VLSHVAASLKMRGTSAQRLVLVGTPTSRWQVAQVPDDSLLIHGEKDDTIPLTSVLDWASPQDLSVTVVPGADHFFHRKLHIIKRIIFSAWHSPA
jgi:alpha/beta superfamily hydrolase